MPAKKLLTLAIFLFTISSIFGRGKDYIIITEHEDIISATNGVFIYSEAGINSSLPSIISHPEKFKRADNLHINYGIQTEAIWLKFKLINSCNNPQDITININNSDLNLIKFYEFRSGKLINQKETGERTNSEDPILRLKGYNYQMTLSPQETSEMYIKVSNNKDAITFPFSINKTIHFLDRQQSLTFQNAFTYGFLCFIIILSLLMYVRLREHQYLFFSLYITFTVCLTATINGYTFKYVFTEHPIIADKLRIIFIYFAVLFAGLYTSTYMQLKKWSKKSYLYFRIFLFTVFSTVVFAAFEGKQLLFTFYIYLGYAVTTLSLIIFYSFRYFKNQPFQSTTLLISFIFPFISVFLMFLRNIGLYESKSVLIGFDYAVITQTLILAYGLINSSRNNQDKILNDLKAKNNQVKINNTKLINANKQLQRLTIASSKTENGIAIFTTSQKTEWSNAAFNKIIKEFGCEQKECKAQKELEEKIYRCAKEQQTIGFNLINYKKQKPENIYRVLLTPVLNDKKMTENIIAVFTDVTEIVKAHQENKRLHELLMQSQKMETIGKLAGGIAHDFNNLLTPIIGYSDMILEDGEHESIEDDITIIKNSAERAKQLISQILSFSKYFKEVKETVSVHEIIDEVISILKSALPSNISINIHKEKGDLYIYADPTQIHQVILNICTNAKQAISPHNGNITIKTELIHNNADVKISISDTGSGIPKELLSNIFTPFFTTKSNEKGTGLGLSIAKDIIEKYKGSISVESKEGEGTCFSIVFPQTERAAKKPQEQLAVDFNGKGKRIMLVDDSEEITSMLKKLLESKSYKVDAFNSSFKALTAFTHAPDQYFAVVTDQTMPEMTGDKLAENIKDIREDIKVVIITGYSETLTKERTAELNINKLLLKPLGSTDLLQTLQDL